MPLRVDGGLNRRGHDDQGDVTLGELVAEFDNRLERIRLRRSLQLAAARGTPREDLRVEETRAGERIDVLAVEEPAITPAVSILVSTFQPRRDRDLHARDQPLHELIAFFQLRLIALDVPEYLVVHAAAGCEQAVLLFLPCFQFGILRLEERQNIEALRQASFGFLTVADGSELPTHLE